MARIPIGLQGADGAQGAQGVQGNQGSDGAQGNQGDQGVAGSQGADGSTGPQGAQGDIGTQGDTGAQGTQGTQGEAGPSTVSDSVLRIQDNTDATKEIAFEASSIATGTTRTITVPDVDVTLATPAELTKLAGIATAATADAKASAAELDTATDDAKFATALAIAASDHGIRYMQVELFGYTTDAATGNGKAFLHIPPGLDGYNLVYVHGELTTAGTTGTEDIQIHNVDNALDMLSTKLTIDTGETGSDTATAAAVINASNDHINTNDVLRIDVDAIHTTAAKGTTITVGFRKP